MVTVNSKMISTQLCIIERNILIYNMILKDAEKIT